MTHSGTEAAPLLVTVVKAVRAPVAPAALREPLQVAAGEPEIAARLPPSPALTLRLTGDRELHRLNRAFLGEDHVTDVLSFPAGDAGAYLGDIAVSWPAVLRQAAEFGHPPPAELALLAIHGFLHLLGWDHRGAVEEREMTRLTRAALAAAGVALAPWRI